MNKQIIKFTQKFINLNTYLLKLNIFIMILITTLIMFNTQLLISYIKRREMMVR
jgi:hypothetical protein